MSLSRTPFISIRNDTIARPGSKRLVDVGGTSAEERRRGGAGRIACLYGETEDGTGGCTLTVPSSSNALTALAVRNVIHIRDGARRAYEYRILSLSDSATGDAVTATAVPILQDLADITLTTLVGTARTSRISGIKSPEGWWNELILPELLRRGINYFTLSTVSVDGAFPFDFSGKKALWLLRQIVQNTEHSVRAVLSPDLSTYLVTMSFPTPAVRIPVVVGGDVIALDRDILGSEIETIVVPYGATAGGDPAPAGIEGVPWLLQNPDGATAEIMDPDVASASFAIEDDQFVGDPEDPPVGIAYPDKALAGGWPPQTIAAAGSDPARVVETLRVGEYLYSVFRCGTGVAGEVHKVNALTTADELTIPVGLQPGGAIYLPGPSVLVVSCTESDTLDVIDAATDTVVGSLVGIPSPTRLYYDAARDAIIVLTAGGAIYILRLSPATFLYEFPLGVIGELVVAEVPESELAPRLSIVTEFPLGIVGELLVSEVPEATVASSIAVARISGLGATDAVIAEDRLWCVNAADLDLSSVDLVTGTLVATTTLITLLETGDEPEAWALIGYDAASDQLFLVGTNPSGNKWSLAIVDPAVPAVLVESRPDTVTYSRPTRITAWGGKVFLPREDAKYLLLSGVDGNVLGAGLFCGGTVDLTSASLLDDEGWMVVGDTGSRLHLWDFRTGCALVLRKIVGVEASASRVTLANGHLGPLRENFPVFMMENDGTTMVELWSPTAVRIYGPLSYPEGSPFRGERNLVMRPVPENFESAIGVLGNVLLDETTPGDMESRWHDPDSQVDTVVVRHAYTAPANVSGFDVDLSAAGFTEPDTSGITAFEYTGGDPARYFVWNTYGGVLPKSGSSDTAIARLNADLVDKGFHAKMDLYHLAIDGPSDTLCLVFNCIDTVLGSWGNDDCLRFRCGRFGSGAVELSLEQIAPGGAVSVLGDPNIINVSFPLSSSMTIGVRVDPVTYAVTTYYDAGAGEVAGPSGVVPVGMRGDHHRRMGLYSIRQNAGSGFQMGNFHIYYDEPVLYTPAAKTVGKLVTGFNWDSWGYDYADLQVKEFPPNYVFNPGDFLILVKSSGNIVTAVRSRVVTDAAGTATVKTQVNGGQSRGLSSGNDLAICYRRHPNDQRALSSEWFVWSNIGGSVPEYTFDVLIPPTPRPGASLYFAIEAYLRAPAVDYPEPMHAVLVAYGTPTYPTPSLPLLDADFVATAEQLTVSPYYAGDAWRDVSCVLPCAALPADSYGHGWYTLSLRKNPAVLYIRRISIYWGFEGVPAFGYGNGVSGIWGVGMLALFNKSEPGIAYRVQSKEATPQIELGSELILTDLARNIVNARPRVVSWQRELEAGDADFHLPTYELENRSRSLIREIAAMGG
jgi:hypothetical protein